MAPTAREVLKGKATARVKFPEGTLGPPNQEWTSGCLFRTDKGEIRVDLSFPEGVSGGRFVPVDPEKDVFTPTKGKTSK